MTDVVVFTTGPGCHKCNATTKRMTKLGIEFTEVDIREQAEWAAALKSAGYVTSPVVLVAGEDIWEDFRLDSINDWGRWLVAA